MLKVLTLNINGPGTKYGPWMRRRGRIREVIGERQPDVVAIQAARKEPGVAGGADQAAQLSTLLPAYSHVAFCAAHHHPDGSQTGSALLAKIPIHAVRAIPLTRRHGLEDDSDRILLHGVFRLAGGPLHLLNAHFSWVEEQARDNVEESLRYLHSVAAPRVLVGDLNCPPECEPMDRLAHAGWVDAWPRLHPDQPGYTFESAELTKRIDYVWVDEQLASRLEAIETVADTSAADATRPSDHLGVLVSLSLDR